MKIVILIPTYNESENIELLLRDIDERIKKIEKGSKSRDRKQYKFEVLVVDDNSPDGTGKIVCEYQKKCKYVRLLSGKKVGLGKAMQRGYKYAIAKMRADVVITNEADFAFSFGHLPYMLKRIEEGADVVVGSRHVGVGKTEGWTLSRTMNHWVANKVFASWIAGVSEVYDHNGAFRAIRVKGVLDQVKWEKMPTGFGFFFYSMYELTKHTDKFDEFAVTYRFRERGESKVSFNPKYLRTYVRDVVEYMKLAVKIRLEKCNINL